MVLRRRLPLAQLNAPPDLEAFATAAGAVRGGTGDARILFIGNSNSAGQNAINGQGMGGNVRQHCLALKVAARLAAAGWPVNTESFLGSQGLSGGSVIGNYDTRLAMGSHTNGAAVSLGGQYPSLNNTGAQPFTFTPLTAINEVRICYIGRTGSCQVLHGAGPTEVANFDTQGPGDYRVSGAIALTALNTTPVRVNWGSQGGRLLGILGRNTNQRAIQCINGAVTGSNAGTYNSIEAFGAPAGIAALDPDLTVINLTSNDIASNVSRATYRTWMQAIITAAQAGGGDVILVVDKATPRNLPWQRRRYIEVCKELAAANGLGGIIDTSALFGEWPTFPAAWRSNDHVHLLGDGVDAIYAAPVANAILGRIGTF